ncbi:MAG: hypothetical protein AAF639_11370 [Chloroflexota bacterium]
MATDTDTNTNTDTNTEQRPTKLNFKHCTLQELEHLFGLTQVEQMPAMTAWLSGQSEDVETEISKYEHPTILHLQRELIKHVHDWNEDELTFGFIAPLMLFANYADKMFNFFNQRLFGSTIDGIELSGKPDGMIASGKRRPQKPYFCFQEYKREQDPEGDPAGQVLAAMLVAQELNEHKHPIYGCYVKGAIWYFVVLQGKEYVISLPYVAVREDIFAIVSILKALKPIIRDLIQ